MRTYLFLFLIIVSISCKKEETKTKSVVDILTTHTWKSTKLVVNGENNDKWCWLNNLFNYTSNKKVFETQGDNLGACSGTIIGEITQYSYSVSGDEKWIFTQIGAIPPRGSDTFQIISISDSKLETKRIINKGKPSQSVWEDTFTSVP